MKRALVSALLPAVLTACGTTVSLPWQQSTAPPADMTGPVGSPGLAMASSQRFADVPIPLDVKENREQTYVFDSGTLQLGRLVYTTRADLNELANFYIQEAPAAGWTRENVVEAEKAVTIYFKKPGKRLIVSINDEGRLVGRKLVLNYHPDSGSAL